MRNLSPKPKASTSIVVYGKLTCGWTSRYISDLEHDGIPYVFKDINIPANAAEMARLTAAAGYGANTGIPVIDRGGKITVGYVDPRKQIP